MYWDLIDDNADIIKLYNGSNPNNTIATYTDYINGNYYGITINKLYNLLIQSDCNTLMDYKNNLKTVFTGASTDISLLFNVYGY